MKIQHTKTSALFALRAAGYNDGSTREEFVILNEHRGDYLTRINWESDGSADIHGTKDTAQATTYTRSEAGSLIAALGRGFALVEFNDDTFQHFFRK